MVMDKGRVIEFDHPTTLLKNRTTVFYSMAKDAGIVN
jgi:ABC-type multidrug transport system fused ATPase/permease subunit